jgi:hypothetical protein
MAKDNIEQKQHLIDLMNMGNKEDNHDFYMDTNKQYKDLFNKMQKAKNQFYRFKKQLTKK